MTNAPGSPGESKSPLLAAQSIVAELQGMKKEDQTLALQFAMQTLRLSAPIPQSSPAPQPANPEGQQRSSAPLAGPPSDIKQFTAAKAPQSDNQFTAVVAYYYAFEAPPSQRRDSIDAATMKEAARLASRKQVKDWNKTLNNATGAGYLDRAERGAFRLNAVGENLVAMTLPGTVWGKAKAAKKKGKKKASRKSAAKKTK